MSKSGIPVVSQIGSGLGKVGSAIGNFLSPSPTAPDAPPATPNPQTDTSTADDMQNAEEEENQSLRGAAANYLTAGGGAGLSSSSSLSVSRSVLLGS